MWEGRAGGEVGGLSAIMLHGSQCDSYRSQCRCENVRSGKVRYKAIAGWLRKERVPHSNLFCDWLFPRYSFRDFFSHNSEKNGIETSVSQLMVAFLKTVIFNLKFLTA